jgi:hypothetical protein
MTSVSPPDDALAARLLAGQPRPHDLDGEYGAVARLLVIAGDGLMEQAEPPHEATLAALRDAAIGSVIDLRARKRRRHIARTLVIAGVVGFGASAAAAANGSLPAPLQDVFHEFADLAGVDIPAGSQDGPDHGRSDEAPGRPEDPGRPVDPRRSDEAPGQPAEPGSVSGVGPDGVPPGQGGTIPGIGDGNAGNGNAGNGSGTVPQVSPPDPGAPVPDNGTPSVADDQTGHGVEPGSAPPGRGGELPPDASANGVANASAGAANGGVPNANANANATGRETPAEG